MPQTCSASESGLIPAHQPAYQSYPLHIQVQALYIAQRNETTAEPSISPAPLDSFPVMSAIPLHHLPISSRPPRTPSQTINAILFFLIFNTGCIMVDGFQFIFLLPLRAIWWCFGMRWAERWYDEGIRYSKEAFATLLVLMSQWFAPTRLSITFETKGQGRFTDEEIKQIVEKDATGKVTALYLPSKSVIIANHQVYCDWWYVWCLTYFSHTHKDVFIVLKKSLKWLPIIGWGMQFYNFVFLARSWVSDKHNLTTHLSKLGKQAQEVDKPLTFILYPEGTLVSKDTRPISKKYAERLGTHDLQNILLPRSTGLHYSLRSLAQRIPSLRMLDITIIYPGVPPKGYGQSYYTLRSIFFDRIPPPVIHMHLRVFDVLGEVPIGDVEAISLSSSDHNASPDVIPHNGTANANGNENDKNGTTNGKTNLDGHSPEDLPEHERLKFDAWLRNLWIEKDEFISAFHRSGSFLSRDAPPFPEKGGDVSLPLHNGSLPNGPLTLTSRPNDVDAAELDPISIPLELRSKWEIPDAFCCFGPAVAAFVWAKGRG